jgi:hypothetical protein
MWSNSRIIRPGLGIFRRNHPVAAGRPLSPQRPAAPPAIRGKPRGERLRFGISVLEYPIAQTFGQSKMIYNAVAAEPLPPRPILAVPHLAEIVVVAGSRMEF